MPKPTGTENCPICGKLAHKSAAPFCSDRCQKVDLHRWLGGVYAVPTAEGPDQDEKSEG